MSATVGRAAWPPLADEREPWNERGKSRGAIPRAPPQGAAARHPTVLSIDLCPGSEAGHMKSLSSATKARQDSPLGAFVSQKASWLETTPREVLI